MVSSPSISESILSIVVMISNFLQKPSDDYRVLDDVPDWFMPTFEELLQTACVDAIRDDTHPRRQALAFLSVYSKSDDDIALFSKLLTLILDNFKEELIHLSSQVDCQEIRHINERLLRYETDVAHKLITDYLDGGSQQPLYVFLFDYQVNQ